MALPSPCCTMPPTPAPPCCPPWASAPQEYLMGLPSRIRKLSERAATRKAKAKPQDVAFSWVFNRTVSI